MSFLDWTIVLAVNGMIIAFGILRSNETKTSADWFLAGRTLPWWIIGLSLYAPVIDSSDLVADAGGPYAVGISYLVTNWVGVVVGWFLLAHFIAPQMYRAGMYTNAEYLEARFNLATRVVSAIVQALYRMLVLGLLGLVGRCCRSRFRDPLYGSWRTQIRSSH
jgi:SSS family solute:Na+ symporter